MNLPDFVLAPALALCLTAPGPTVAQGAPAPPFDAALAWTSFEELLREEYAYFDRPGVDGSAILAAFAGRARAARSDAAFIDVLQLAARNFADPHFIVGPLDAGDWSVIPTSSDIFATYDGVSFRVHEVRADSDALAKGVSAGMVIRAIDSKAPVAAVEAVMGRPFSVLNPAQIGFGLNVALAGHRGRPRSIRVDAPHGERLFNLAPANDQARRVRSGPPLEVQRQGSLGIIRINNALGDNKLIAEFGEALAMLADTTTLVIDLRNTPSGGNTSVARGIMGRFVTHDRPYQTHVIPYESRTYGPARKFVEYVSPFSSFYPGKVYAVGGRWTGSMGEGMMIGLDAIGATTVGTDLADLLGALGNRTIEGSKARIDIGTEALFTVTGLPWAEYRPQLYLERAERTVAGDPALAVIQSQADSHRPPSRAGAGSVTRRR